ncbi:hypothetical protein BDN71DRAFT_989529 [Pleurotus eryngii]|uniref:Methyltransferase domain-containing protein n=1 Tax=Pleurotus eryngii TaxID=5323 RepID=A0A9P5ZWF8_PLEER|nr:hypothetical protein BDN71DRAFT_989529 [Pleurotus eryngii]
MSSRSAGGRRRQLKSAAKAHASSPQPPPAPPTPSYASHSPQSSPGQGQMYTNPYIQPSPDSYYQPFSPTVQPIAPSPIPSHDDKRWYQHPVPKDVILAPLVSARFTRVSTPPSSPDALTPTTMSFSSMSLSSASSTRSPAPTYTTLSPTMYSPELASSPPSLSPKSYGSGPSSPPLLLQPHQPQQPQQSLQQVVSRASANSSNQAFVYPTCRSNARPTNSSPTTPSFPKISLKSNKKKGLDPRSNDEGKSSTKGEPAPGGRFRALLKRSKKKRALTPIISETPTPLTPEPINITRQYSPTIQTNESIESFAWLKKQDQTLHPYTSEAPYMQAYDPPFLESDKQFTRLLQRLAPRGSPCFHDYGRHPPVHVLDLGCGTGTWALEAASHWKAHGTRITGFDLVDVARDEWGRARNVNATQNLRFVRGNFLTYRLPFPDKTFDLVRMANLTLCIPYSKWEQVLGEVRRVMTINGRLELVDDQIMFPYARPFSPSSSPPPPRPPRLDIPIPSSSFNVPRRKEYEEDEYNLDDVLGDDDSDLDGETSSSTTPTVSGGSDTSSRRSTERVSSTKGSIPSSGSSNGSKRHHPSTSWDLQAGSCQGLETVFENMLNERYHVHPRPSEFLLDVLKRIFGKRHTSLMRSMHIELAPTEFVSEDPIPIKQGSGYGAMAAAAAAANLSRGRVQDALSQCPGIVVWPSTYIPIPAQELQMHACKHIRTLLGCKSALADYVELRDNDGARIVDEEFWDAMHDYESFIRQRFEGLARAPDTRLDPSQGHARTESVETSDSASTYQDSVLEYQSMFRNRFDLGTENIEPAAEIDSIRIASPTGVFQNYDGLHFSRSSAVPPYTPQELTHIRTIRVFEALKLSDEALS